MNTNNRENNNFLILTEFKKLSSFNFKICNPILSYNLNKKINDLTCLSRGWKLSKKMKKIE